MFHHHMEDHVLLINDKPNKAICNSHYNRVFLESFKGQHLSNYNIQVMDLCLHLWLILKHLPHVLIMKKHYPYMCILFCPPFVVLSQTILGSCNIKWATMEILYICIPCLVSILYFEFLSFLVYLALYVLFHLFIFCPLHFLL
jgi:hypothetical protein